jgi:hypothetical protein
VRIRKHLYIEKSILDQINCVVKEMSGKGYAVSESDIANEAWLYGLVIVNLRIKKGNSAVKKIIDEVQKCLKMSKMKRE